MNRPRRITWLIQGDEIYGVRRMVLSLVGSVLEAGWHVDIVALSDGLFAAECRERGWNVADLAAGPTPVFSGGLAMRSILAVKLLLRQRQLSARLAEITATMNSDAIHVLWPNLVGLAGAAAYQNGVACFWEIPNILGRYPWRLNQRIYQWLCHRYKIVPLAISKFVAASLASPSLVPELCYLGADSAHFDPGAVIPISREEIGIPANAIVLAIFARICEAKGQDRLLKAMLTLGRSDRPLHLLLLGGPLDSPFVRALQKNAANMGASDRLHMPGVVTKPEKYYGAIDVAVNFTPEPEPFGLSVVEAMMMAKPVLIHASGGPAETVIDGVTGWHVNDASVNSLVLGLTRSIADYQSWVEMGKAARDHTLAHFSLARQTATYMAIVERVLSKPLN